MNERYEKIGEHWTESIGIPGIPSSHFEIHHRTNGNVHFIDTVGFPHKDKINFKPVAVECESRSSKPQQESNRHDLAEFKKRYPDAEIFQVNNAEEVDFKRLNRMEQRPFFRPPIRRF